MYLARIDRDTFLENVLTNADLSKREHAEAYIKMNDRNHTVSEEDIDAVTDGDVDPYYLREGLEESIAEYLNNNELLPF